MPLIYNKGFDTECAEPGNIIGIHDTKIKNIIYNQMKDDDIFIDSTWVNLDGDLKNLIHIAKEKNSRVFCYSGPDWNNALPQSLIYDRYENVHNALKECNTTYIGNQRGTHFFSWWIDFVIENIEQYQTFDPYELKFPIKTYMCLNRKPHRHRIELVNQLKHHNLMDWGHVSLGGDSVIRLSTDLSNPEGDKAVGGDVGITNDINTLGHPHNWNSHFLNVVTETTTYTDVFVTEKTLKPIIGRRPFLILGDNNIYAQLKDWGFDTFDDMFGTGYNMPAHEDRIEWIISVLNDLKQEKDLDKLLHSIMPRLEHNYNQLFDVARQNKEKLHNLI